LVINPKIAKGLTGVARDLSTSEPVRGVNNGGSTFNLTLLGQYSAASAGADGLVFR
jgi:hypothetical protein